MIENWIKRARCSVSYDIKVKSAEFKLGISELDHLLKWQMENPEAIGICMVGRSNVGKSSLINKIFGAKTARVSNTPGRTREVNIFTFQLTFDNKDFQHPPLFLIDLPGYGHAEVSKQMSKNWERLMGQFFLGLSPHLMVINIQDARHPDQKSDREFYKFMRDMHQEVILMFNKIDKLKTQKERSALQKSMVGLSKNYKKIRKMFFVSAETGDQLPPAVHSIVQYLMERIEFQQQS